MWLCIALSSFIFHFLPLSAYPPACILISSPLPERQASASLTFPRLRIINIHSLWWCMCACMHVPFNEWKAKLLCMSWGVCHFLVLSVTQFQANCATRVCECVIYHNRITPFAQISDTSDTASWTMSWGFRTRWEKRFAQRLDSISQFQMEPMLHLYTRSYKPVKPHACLSTVMGY